MAQLPSLDDYMAGRATLPPPDQISAPPSPVPQGSTANPIIAGLQSGAYGALGNFARAVQGGAKLVGYDTGAANAGARAADFEQQAAQAGRPDLEQQGWTGGGVGGAIKYGAYRTAQFLPQLAGFLGSAAALSEVAPEAAAGGVLTKIGSTLPGFLGGTEDALAAAQAARKIGIGAAAMYPQVFGGEVAAADKQPGGLTQGDAAKAAALGVPISAIQSLGPHGASGFVPSTLAHAATFGIGSGLQQGVEDSFDPNMTAGERAQRVVQAAVQGATFGGLLGGATGIMEKLGSPKITTDATNDQLSSTVDQAVQPNVPSSGIDTMPVHPTYTTEYSQQPLDLGNVYRAEDFRNRVIQTGVDEQGNPTIGYTGPQGDLFKPSGFGNVADYTDPNTGAMRDAIQPQSRDTRFADRLARLGGPAPEAVPDDVATQTGQFAGTKAAMKSFGRRPEPPEQANLPLDQDALLRSTMGEELPDQQPQVSVADALARATSEGNKPAMAALSKLQEDRQNDPNAEISNDPQVTSAVQDLMDKISLFSKFGDRDNQIGSRGMMRDWITNSDARSEPELYNQMADELEQKSPVSRSKTFKGMAQQIGLLGEDNKPFDMAAERQEAAEIPNEQARANRMAELDQIQQRADAAAQLKEPTEAKVLGADQPQGIAFMMTNAMRAQLRDRGYSADDIKSMKPTDAQAILSEAPRQEPAEAALAAPEAPKSIADRVVDAAHDLTGGTGGEAKISDIRAKLPDVAKEDLDNALKQIHGDDSDNTLTQAPKGQRAGVDGVSIQGAGRFHNLSVEPRDAVQVGSTEGLDANAPAGPVQGVREGDTGQRDIAGQEPEQRGEAQPQEAGAGPNQEALPTEQIGSSPLQTTRALRRASGQTIEGRQFNANRAIAQELLRRVRDGELPKPGHGLVRATLDRNPDGSLTMAREAIGTTPEQRAAELQIPEDKPLPPPEPKLMPKMSTVPQDRVSMPFEDVKAGVADAIKTFKPEAKARVITIRDASELPQNIRAAAARQGMSLDNMPGLYMDGKVYVNASRITNAASLQDVVAHEVVGHMGAAEQFGAGRAGTTGRFDAFMQSLVDRVGGDRGIEKLARQLGIWDEHGPHGAAGVKAYRDAGFNSREIMEEIIAHATAKDVIPEQQRAYMTFVSRAKEAIANMLDKAGLSDFAKAFRTFTASDVARFIEDSRNALEDKQPPNTIDLASLPAMRTQLLREAGLMDRVKPLMSKEDIGDQSADTNGVMKAVGVMRDQVGKLPLDVLQRTLNTKVINNLKTLQDMQRSWDGKAMFNGLIGKQIEMGARGEMIGTRAAEYRSFGEKASDAMRIRDLKAFDNLSTVSSRASFFDLNPEMSFADHTWLRDKGNLDELREEHADLQRRWNQLGQKPKGGGPTGQQIYRAQQAAYAADLMFAQSNKLHNAIKSLRENVEGLGRNVTETIPDLTNRRDPNEAFQTARAGLERDLAALDQHLMKMTNGKSRDALSSLSDEIKDTIKKQERGVPYNHMGRFGDNFVSFRAAASEGSQAADPAAIKAFEDVLSKNGMDDYMLNTVGSNRDVFIRIKSARQTAQFVKDLHELHASSPEHFDPGKEIRSGSITSNADMQGVNMGKTFEAMETAIRSSMKNDPEAADKAVAAMRAFQLDMTPQDSSLRLQSRRAGVQGSSKDVIENMRHYNSVMGNALAKGAFMVDKAQNEAAMKQKVLDSQTQGDHQKSLDMQDAYNAVIDRNNAQTQRVASGVWDAMRTFGHSFYLAMSPGYFMMQLAQLGTLTVPELIKDHGIGQTMRAMARGGLDTAKILRAFAAVKADQLKQASEQGFADYSPGLSDEVLAKAAEYGVSQKTLDYLRVLDNMGKLEGSTFGHENLAGLNQGPWANRTGKVMRFFNTTATMSELTARLTSAIAAKHAWDHMDGPKPGLARFNGDVAAYGSHVVSESMFDWGPNQTSKWFSRSGPLGPASPAVFQFHGFSTRLYNKLATETYNAIKGETPEEQAQAQRFMVAHLVVTTALAGTLGLPFAGWSAGAITHLSQLFNNGEAYDVEAHYNHFLETVFGKQLGQVVARGLPRFVGADMSDLGDKDLLPMQEFMEDRRKWQDSLKDYMANAWGSSFGGAIGAAFGVNDMAQGRVIPGLAKFLPTALRNVAQAYLIGEHGYQDAQGHTLNIDAGTTAVLKQILGIKSGDMAEYQEQAKAAEGIKSDRSYHSGLILNGIARAAENGDQEGYKNWLVEAQKYDQDPNHVGNWIMPRIPAYLEAWQRAKMQNLATGLPIGVSPRDLPTLQLLSGG